jgi:glycosyltransferase involved in cell wall biosynthesis
MKLLYIANVSDLYGASRSLLRLASQFAKEGHEVDVILPADGPLRERLEAAGAKTLIHPDLPILCRRALRSPRGLAGLLAGLVSSTLRLIVHIRRHRPDLVHSNSAVILSPCLAAKLCGTPHVWHMREFFADISGLWLAYQWFMYWFATVIVCNSNAVARQFHGVIRKRKVAVIYNGIPNNEITSSTADQVAAFRRKHALRGYPLVGVVGRINLEQKGQDVFAQAAAALAPRFPDAGFVVAGSPYPGNEEHGRRLNRLVEELELGGRFTCIGEVDRIAVMYSALDVCVLPARKPEGLGNVLIEAMALGKPLVGSAIGGIPEIIEDGKNGFLVRANDAGALARALEQLLEDPALRRRMGEQGRRRFEELFEFNGCYSRLRSVYWSALKRRPAAAGAPATLSAPASNSPGKTP